MKGDFAFRPPREAGTRRARRGRTLSWRLSRAEHGHLRALNLTWGWGAGESQRSSALHRASRANRQSPFTASCRQESQALESHHGPGTPPLPHGGPELVWRWQSCTKLTKDPRILQGMICQLREGRAVGRGEAKPWGSRLRTSQVSPGGKSRGTSQISFCTQLGCLEGQSHF